MINWLWLAKWFFWDCNRSLVDLIYLCDDPSSGNSSNRQGKTHRQDVRVCSARMSASTNGQKLCMLSVGSCLILSVMSGIINIMMSDNWQVILSSKQYSIWKFLLFYLEFYVSLTSWQDLTLRDSGISWVVGNHNGW